MNLKDNQHEIILIEYLLIFFVVAPSPPSTPKKKRAARNELAKEERNPYRKKIFQKSWLKDPAFQHWLRPINDDPTKCTCIACNVIFVAGKSEIKKHANGKRHEKNVVGIVRTPSVANTFHISKITTGTKSAELTLSAFFANSNVALRLTDSLLPILKRIFPDSKICQEMTLSRRKCTSIITNVLSPVAIDKVIKEVSGRFYSILADESTDVADTKFMALLVRYLDSETFQVRTQLLEMIPLHVTDFSGRSLYEEFTRCLMRYNLSATNIVGMASDNANVMTGQNNSFYSRLREDNPFVILMRCICHSAALIAGNACEKLPRSPEDLVRNIATYVSGSSKRSEALKNVQESFQVERKKILKLSDTRWLALHNCVERVLEYYKPLIAYFVEAVQKDKLIAAENILKSLKDSCIKAYLLFLKYVLKKFNTFSLLFQSEDILVTKLSEESRLLFNDLCLNFIKTDYLRNIYRISITDPNHLKATEDVTVGAECELLLQSLPKHIQLSVKNDCLQFYLTAAQEMKSRLPLNDKLFDEFQLLDPKFLFSSRAENVKIPLLIEKFNGWDKIDIREAENELVKLYTTFSIDEIVRFKGTKITSFWREMRDKANFAGDKLFPNATKLAELVLSLPHSNADAERIFSMMKDVKTDKRNRLDDANLNGILTFRSSMRDSNEFKVENDHLMKFNKDMYKYNNYQNSE